jgi:AcrR family transcriptional regulator
MANFTGPPTVEASAEHRSLNAVQYAFGMRNGQAATPVRRRRDILDAAGALLAERSWDGFAMRDVAARAGLSAGALYQYFAGKHEIFAALYNERLAAERDALAAFDEAELDPLARHLVESFAEIYSRVGRHQLAWAAEGIDRTASVDELGATFHSLAAEVERSLQQAAARSGRVLVASDARMPLLWAMVNGIGDQLVDERYRLHDCTRDEFLRFSTEAFIAALTRAAVPSPSADAVM